MLFSALACVYIRLHLKFAMVLSSSCCNELSALREYLKNEEIPTKNQT